MPKEQILTEAAVTWQVARPEDKALLLRLMEEFNQFLTYDFNPKQTMSCLDEFMTENPPGRLWCIQWEGQCVGYVVITFGFSFEYGGHDAIIDEFYLREPYRNRGIGADTLDYIVEQSKFLGIKAIHLEVEKFNGSGRGLYLKKGFTDSNRILLTRKL